MSSDRQLRYVALGDSYTIGTSVGETERWPNRLVERIGAGYPRLELVANLAVNGYTSRDVIHDELPQLDALEPEFASLLIGVNDVVQGVPEAAYRENVEHILEDLVRRVGRSNIIVLTIPDYTVTPAGADYGDRDARSAGIRRFNEVMAELTQLRSLALLDVHGISLRAADDRSLVAADGLHPSGLQYGLWVDAIVGDVEDLLWP